jgi:hypothetical protein
LEIELACCRIQQPALEKSIFRFAAKNNFGFYKPFARYFIFSYNLNVILMAGKIFPKNSPKPLSF